MEQAKQFSGSESPPASRCTAVTTFVHPDHSFTRPGFPLLFYPLRDLTMSILNNAQNVTIDEFSFQNAQNIYNYVQNGLETNTALDILDKERSVEATTKSNTAECAPKCHPKTRQQVTGDLMAWIEDPRRDPSQSILWFEGPAGAGKTCIMREVAARCEARSPDFVPGSYFFSTRAGVHSKRPFVATITHQLLLAASDLTSTISAALSRHRNIFRDGLISQIETLIVQPWLAHAGIAPKHKLVLIVDGFDECSEVEEREHLLSCFYTLATKLSPSISILIASRPELDIRTAFDTPLLSAITKKVKLHLYDGRQDVRVFLCDEFEKIRRSHTLKNYIPHSWPSEEEMVTLVDKSSGSFIYPATVIRYIAGQPRRNPVSLLERALNLDVSSGSDDPLKELHALYSHILHPPDVDFLVLKRILHTIMEFKGATRPEILKPRIADQFFDYTPGSASANICDLHSLIDITPYDNEGDIEGPMRFHHKSIEDYLHSKRSDDLYQPVGETVLDLMTVLVHHVDKLRLNPFISPDAFDDRLDPNLELAQALVECWTIWLDQCLEYCAGHESVHLPQVILNFDPRSMWGSSKVLEKNRCTAGRSIPRHRYFTYELEVSFPRMFGFIAQAELSVHRQLLAFGVAKECRKHTVSRARIN